MAKNLRYSQQRENIYQYLLSSRIHPSAEMIYTDLKEEHPELSLGTVYRNLKLLEELGKVRRVTTHQGNERYDAICGDHAHFVCQGCGAILDLEGVNPESLRENLPLEEGYRLGRVDLLVTGRCPKCG